MARYKDYDWNMKGPSDDGYPHNTILVNVLMDIRDELKRINSRLDCRQTLAIPGYLSEIRRLLQPPKPKRRVRSRRP